jgi:hypothetical protein
MYPISYAADPILEGRNRLTSFFRIIVAIPWLIVAAVYQWVAEIVAIIAWFAIVFTGKYPDGLYNFNAGYVRMYSRTYSFLHLLNDEWPPFGGEEAPDYPVRIGVPAPLDRYDRLKTGFRFILLIPVAILAFLWYIVLYVCSIIAWFAILFTGKLPEGLFKPIRSGLAYWTRASAYGLLITEDFPPFSYEEASAVPPAGQIGSEAASSTPENPEG